MIPQNNTSRTIKNERVNSKKQFRMHSPQPEKLSINLSPDNHLNNKNINNNRIVKQNESLYHQTLLNKIQINQLLKENFELIQQKSEQNLLIKLLLKKEKISQEQKVNSVNSLPDEQDQSKQQQIRSNCRTEFQEREHPLHFTFYSPKQTKRFKQNKLPQVFQVAPQLNKYYI